MASTDCTSIPQFWPELDWDSLFTQPEETESTQIMSHHFQDANAHALESVAAKKRKRIQSIVFSEKTRRKRMRQFLATLTSILPIPICKVARYCLIEETIKYIEKLHERVQKLKENRERLLARKSCHAMDSVNVDVKVYGNEVIIRIMSLKMPSDIWKMYHVIEAQHLMDIQSADIYRGDCIVVLSFLAVCSDGSCLQLKHCLQTDLQQAYGS